MKTRDEIQKAIKGIETTLQVYTNDCELMSGCSEMIDKLQVEIDILKWVLK